MIKRYNTTNAKLKRGQAIGAPSVSIRNGSFRLNRACCDLLGVEAGEGVEMIHDEKAGEWYLTKGGEDGFTLGATGNSALQFGSILMEQAMSGFLPEPEGSTVKLNLAKVPTKVEGAQCFAILGLVRP